MMFLEAFTAQLGDANTWIGLVSLTLLLIVLDIDNVVFMTILGANLKENERKKTVRQGLFIGLGMRVLMLLGIGYLKQIEKPLFALDLASYHNDFTVEVLITLAGGVFLMFKSVREIHDKLEGPEVEGDAKSGTNALKVLMQIVFLNVIFSVDSVLTAVGMTELIWVMIGGLVLSFAFIYAFALPISRFVTKHPTMKMLGLAFLLLIGLLLVTEALPKGYIYFAMVFALLVEFANIKIRKSGKPVALHEPHFDFEPDPQEDDHPGEGRLADDPL
ncbi:MAG: TerC family protein [Bacteroidota bacterium]